VKLVGDRDPTQKLVIMVEGLIQEVIGDKGAGGRLRRDQTKHWRRSKALE
jgi:hypothetical protein